VVKRFWIPISGVLLKNGRLDLLHNGNELVSRCLPITWRGGRYGNGCTGRRVANAGWYVCAACSVLVQKPVNQHKCHVVTFVFLEMHVMKIRCSDHNQYESHDPFVIRGTVLHSSLIKLSTSFGKRRMFTHRCISAQPSCCLGVDSTIIYSFLFIIENIVTYGRFNCCENCRPLFKSQRLWLLSPLKNSAFSWWIMQWWVCRIGSA
jgi:hypothetical protein